MNMKRILLLLLLTSMLLFAEKSSTNEAPFRLGIGGAVGTESFRGGMRFWIKDRIGATINAGSTWDRDIEMGEAQLHIKLLKEKRFSPYFGAGVGLSRINVPDRTPPAYNENLWSISAHIGGELFLGNYRRHGLSLQIDYTNGTLEYKKRNLTVIGDGAQNGTTGEVTLTPFSGKVLYHFYFVPSTERDKDGDGVKDDKCPDQAEDFDGFRDDDGCPETDNDGDGINDSDDKCPNDAEDMDSFEDNDGCPDVDNDKDGIKDVEDKCPNSAEDIDSFEDNDGCPDVDNDNDGVLDVDDKCPDQQETKNGFHDDDGCFDSVIPEIVEEEITKLPTETIQFELNSATLRESSTPVLDSLASLLIKYSSIAIVVEGHTDTKGAVYTNKVMSEKRALAVKEYLIGKEIESGRIETVGYGHTKPKFDNKTREGRIRNRRVEIKTKE